ncbi:MAG TPA: hypothetical protein PK228_13175, partial [Saprospiraceae bacterium]|nr:hypothetical protein [Saprospiraceae bacterium]
MTAFLISSALLKIAGIWVQLFKRTRLFRRPAAKETLLSQHDTQPERSQHIRDDRERYVPVRLTEKLRIDSKLRLRAIKELPPDERYPVGILIPKLLIIAALKIRG